METIYTRNQTAHIDPDDLYAILVKVNAGIEDRDHKIEDQKAIIYAMSGGQGERIVSANKTLQKRIAEKDQEISKQREVIERFELHESMVVGNLREINTKLHKTIRSQDDTICEMVNEIDELESELGNMKQQLNERHELLQHMTSRDWKQSNEIVGMKVSHGKERVADRKTIKELKAKLADRERQFNELDAILGRTRNSMLCANEYIGKQNVQIEELESKLVDNRDVFSELQAYNRDLLGRFVKKDTGVMGAQIKNLEREVSIIHREKELLTEQFKCAYDGTQTIKAELADVIAFNVKLVHDTNKLFAESDVTIKELETEISAQKKASKTVDKWHFHVGDKVVSTDHAKRTESIYIEGHVVRVYGDILFVDVGGHIESVSFSWMEKV